MKSSKYSSVVKRKDSGERWPGSPLLGNENEIRGALGILICKAKEMLYEKTGNRYIT